MQCDESQRRKTAFAEFAKLFGRKYLPFCGYAQPIETKQNQKGLILFKKNKDRSDDS